MSHQGDPFHHGRERHDYINKHISKKLVPLDHVISMEEAILICKLRIHLRTGYALDDFTRNHPVNIEALAKYEAWEQRNLK